jgi:hypothetical protein
MLGERKEKREPFKYQINNIGKRGKKKPFYTKIMLKKAKVLP